MNPGRTRRIAALDGLRGLAALEVVLRHQAATYHVDVHPVVDLFQGLFRHGPVGHPLFFLLTGFGLTQAIRGHRDRPEPRLGPFLFGRWRRLAPPYYVALGLCLIVPFGPGRDGRPNIATGPPGLATVLEHLAFLHGLRPDSVFAISPPLWSMSLTVQFCVIFPLLYVAMARGNPRNLAILVLAAWLAARWWLEAALGFDALTCSVFILYRLPPFVLGMAVAFESPSGAAGPPPRARPWGLLGALGLGAAVIGQEFTWGWPVDLIYAGAYAAILRAILDSSRRGGVLAHCASRPGLTWLGAASYAIYVTHDLVLSRWIGLFRAVFPDPWLPTDLAMIMLGPILAIAFGRVFFLKVERPLQTWLSDRAPQPGIGRSPRLALEGSPAVVGRG